MLTHPTLDKLHQLRLLGMAKAFEEQMHMTDVATLSTEERLGLMVDRELTARADRRLQTRLRPAKLRHAAAVEDINYRHPRGLDRALMAQLAGCAWLGAHHNILITGPPGIGKSWLGCALAQKACREGYSARYVRAPRFFRELTIARGDGRYAKLIAALAKTQLLVLDDFASVALNDEHRRDLLEILDDRYDAHSTL